MKTLWILVGAFLVSVMMYALLLEPEWTTQEVRFECSAHRPSITFITGQDKPGQQYFELAEKHFLWHSSEGTDVVVRTCRDLSSILTYLNEYATDDHPWGVINVVLHGNVWSGLSLAMWPEGPRGYPKELFRAAKEDRFPILEEGVVDAETKVNFWACGIGKNPLINLALDQVFTSTDGLRAEVYASPHFVVFQEGMQGVDRHRASYWPYFFKRGYRPSISQIAQDYNTRFPEIELDWAAVVTGSARCSHERVTTEEFHIPVVWTALYPDKSSRPAVDTDEEKRSWIASQDGLVQQIENLEIPMNKYNWQVNRIIYRHPDGRTQPAIKAIGMSTVLCVLQRV